MEEQSGESQKIKGGLLDRFLVDDDISLQRYEPLAEHHN
jgi:hypothetical protein